MQHNKDFSIKRTIHKYEGGFTNNPRDPGGATKYGITIHDAQRYWKPDATPEDVRAMPIDVAVMIYREKYWVNAFFDCDRLDAGVDFAAFDFGVNSGVARASKFLVASHVENSPVRTIKKLCAKRLAFLQHLKTYKTFGRGWKKRVIDVEATAIRLAHEAEGHTPAVVKQKLIGEHLDASNKSKTEAAKGGAVALAGAVGAKKALAPAMFFSWPLVIKWGLVALVALAVLYFGYRWWVHRHRAKVLLKVADEDFDATPEYEPQGSPLMRKIKGWRTFAAYTVCGSSAMIMATLQYLKDVDFTAWFTPPVAGALALFLTLGGIWLRTVTTTPMGQNGED